MMADVTVMVLGAPEELQLFKTVKMVQVTIKTSGARHEEKELNWHEII